MLAKVEGCQVSVEEWRCQRQIYMDAPQDDVRLGFALFFLNRTSRSGIIDARPIGGYEQMGKWKTDARFDKEGLANRIGVLRRMAAEYRFVK